MRHISTQGTAASSSEKPTTDSERAFAARLRDIYTGATLTQLIDIGQRTGLFKAMAGCPGTSLEISARAGLNERYVREWLAGMASGGIVEYHAVTEVFSLPPAHAVLLTGETARNATLKSLGINSVSRHIPALSDCFRFGGGVPYEAFQPDFTDAMDTAHRITYDEVLIRDYIGAVDGLRVRLEAGIRVLDVGCGAGYAVALLARAFPRSTFHGCDVSAAAIQQARTEAAQLENATFTVCDAAEMTVAEPFDLVFALKSMHHQHSPEKVLRKVHRLLANDGVFLMVEQNFSSRLANNLDNPLATMYYGGSVTHCLTVSLAEGGAGLGSMWGWEAACEMLAAAGFQHIELVDGSRPQDCIFVGRKT